MVMIRYEDNEYACEPGETVLECLERHGVSVPNSCRAGVCQTCLMQALEGEVPAEGQSGLKDTLVMQKFFLACITKPTGDLTVALPDAAQVRVPAEVLEKDLLAPFIVRLRLKPKKKYDWHPGQFLNLFRGDLTRSYSIASLPEEGFVELHIARVPGGKMSGWVFDELQVGEAVEISRPQGKMFYVPGRPDQPLLMIATGTGLAPLYGILRDALEQGHTGPIWLYHGSRVAEGLYLRETLQQLAETHPNVHYRPCLSQGEPPVGVTAGRPNEVALEEHPDLKGWRVFLCGNPDMVKAAQRQVFLAGASMQDILTDPFEPAKD